VQAPSDLVEAIKTGDTEAVRARIAEDRTLASATDETGLSLVLLALFHRQREAADALLEAHPRLGVLEAAALGRTDILRAHPDRLHERTPEGFTPIGLAAFLGGADAVRTLLELGVDPDADNDNQLGVRPVHAAAAAGDRESLRLLLEAGADAGPRQQGGLTPLHTAAHLGDVEMVRMLLEHGADPHQTDDEGRSPATLATGDAVADALSR
jgi:ankyrin repeat protein